MVSAMGHIFEGSLVAINALAIVRISTVSRRDRLSLREVLRMILMLFASDSII